MKPLHPVGFFTSEIRQADVRKGFEFRGLTGEAGLLAHVNLATPYRVGRYKVDVKGFEAFLEAIPLLRPSAGLIVIDEIGKMECLSGLFRRLVREALDSDKAVLATIAQKGDAFIEKIKRREDVSLIKLVESCREAAAKEIIEEIRDIHARVKSAAPRRET